MTGCARRGYDARKKINETRRHLAVDVLGLLLSVLVTAASTQDGGAARPLLRNLRRAFRYVYWVMVIVMTGRLARSPAATLVPRQETSALAIRR